MRKFQKALFSSIHSTELLKEDFVPKSGSNIIHIMVTIKSHYYNLA